MTRKQARIAILAATAAIGAACQATAPTDPTSLPGNEVSAPPGLEAAGPFPIDRGDDGAYTPGTYKGLWLRLYDNGAPVVTAVDGVIGVVCVGMSNANQECGDYINRLSTEYATEVTPAIRVVNCAVGGHAIERWNDPAYDGTLWDDCVTRKLAAAGVRLDQVRVIYHKAANQFTTGAGGAVLPHVSRSRQRLRELHAQPRRVRLASERRIPRGAGGVYDVPIIRRLRRQ
jgi:hypothetical protein